MFNKKLKSMFAVALSVSMVTSSMATGNVASAATKPKKITITNVKGKTLKMTKGKKFTLKYKMTPSKASKKVKFKTSNSKVAKVTTKGKITAVKKGTAKITIKSKVNSKVKKTITVKVSNPAPKKTTTPKVTATPVVTPTVPAGVQTISPETNPPHTLEPENTKNPGITPVQTSTSTPTTAPAVLIEGKTLKLGTVTINGDLTVMVKASCADGTKLDSFSPTTVKTALAGTKLNLTNGKVTLVADYQNYSYDNDCVTYVLDDSSKAKLQPSKNGGDVGSADGEYTITSTAFTGEAKASYYETLVGNYLTGYVYDTDLATPLKGAVITASTSDSSKSATTDENGFYKIPLSSATYKIKCKTDKYFDMESTAKISNNNGTACNFNVREYAEDKLIMYGRVVNSESGEPVSRAEAAIYQIDKTGKEKKVGSIITSAKGYFLVKNSNATTTAEYAKLKETVDTPGTTLYYNPLSNDYTYKVVISKSMKQDKYNTVESKILEGISFSSGMVNNLGVTKVTPVKEVKELKVNVTLPIELQRELTSKARMQLDLYEKNTESDIAKSVGTTMVNIDADTKSIDVLKDTKMFTKSPTMPNNTYYFRLSYSGYTSGWVAFKVSDAVAEVPVLNLQKTKNLAINSTFNIINEKAVENRPEDGIVEVFTDEQGTLSGRNLDVRYNIYQIIDGQKVYVDWWPVSPTFGTANTIRSSVSLWVTGKYGVIPGMDYSIECDSDHVFETNKEVRFTLEDAVSVNIDYNVGAGASIAYLNVKDPALFENADSKVRLEYVKVLDSDGKEVGYSDFRELNDKESENAGVTKAASSWVSKVELIGSKGKNEGMIGLKPSNLKAGTGKYKVVVKFAGYQEAVKEVALLDFQECSVTLDEKIKKEELTGFTGTITLNGNDIQDDKANTTDASVMLYKGKEVVGVAKYGYSTTGTTSTKYKLENGINAVLEDGNYTLVVRCSKNAKLQFDTVAKEVKVVNGKLVSENIEVTAGNTSSTTLGITDTNNKQLVKPMVCLIDSYTTEPLTLKVNEKVATAYKTLMNKYPEICGYYYMTAEKNLVEFSRMENMSKGNYSVWVNSNDTTLIKVHEFTLGSSAHYTKADLKVDVNKYDATVPVTVEYVHSTDLASGLFDVATLEDADGKVVDRQIVLNPATKAGQITSVVLKAPNVSGTYKVVIYSTGSFTSTENVVVQGVSKSVKVVLTEAGLK